MAGYPTSRGAVGGSTGGSQLTWVTAALPGTPAAGDLLVLLASIEANTSESFTAALAREVTATLTETSEAVTVTTGTVSSGVDTGSLVLDTTSPTRIPGSTTISSVGSSTTFTLSANATNISGTAPSQVLALVPGGTSPTSALTAVVSHLGSGSGSAQSTFLYRVLTSTDISDGLVYVVVTCSVNSQWAFAGAVFEASTISGSFDPGAPTAPFTGNNNTTTVGAAGITTGGTDTLLVWLAAASPTANGTPPTITVPSSPSAWTQIGSQQNATISGSHIDTGVTLASFQQASPGSTGTVSGSVPTGSYGSAVLIGIAAASAPASSGLLLASGLV